MQSSRRLRHSLFSLAKIDHDHDHVHVHVKRRMTENVPYIMRRT
jgi:hypothetical protein